MNRRYECEWNFGTELYSVMRDCAAAVTDSNDTGSGHEHYILLHARWATSVPALEIMNRTGTHVDDRSIDSAR